jgi:4a-hydroxytetrahydrobiopterin dehydratase
MLRLALNFRIGSQRIFNRSNSPCNSHLRSMSTGVPKASTDSGEGLAAKKCVPCEGSASIVAFDRPAAEEWSRKLQEGWGLREDAEGRLHLFRTWKTKNFLAALEMCRRVGDVAEEEGHHPDLHVESWNKLTIDLWTHARNGLTENDVCCSCSTVEDLNE